MVDSPPLTPPASRQSVWEGLDPLRGKGCTFVSTFLASNGGD